MTKENCIHALLFEGKICNDHLLLFDSEVNKIKAKHNAILNITLDSPGGDANVAVKIINEIRRLKEKNITIKTHSNTLAGSAALAIYIQGDFRSLENSALLVIDLPFNIYEKKLILGYPETEIELLKLIEENKLIQTGRSQWAEMYAEITQQDVNVIYHLEGKYMNAIEAKNLGFCHKITNNLS